MSSGIWGLYCLEIIRPKCAATLMFNLFNPKACCLEGALCIDVYDPGKQSDKNNRKPNA